MLRSLRTILFGAAASAFLVACGSPTTTEPGDSAVAPPTVEVATPIAPTSDAPLTAPGQPTVVPPPPPPPPPVTYRTVKSWDFLALEADQLEWVLPGGSKQKSDQGAVFILGPTGGSGPQLADAGIDATSVDAVRVVIKANYAANPEVNPDEVKYTDPSSVAVYWANDAALETVGESEWPFDNSRAWTLNKQSDQVNTWFGTLANREGWEGTIQRLMIGLTLPEIPDVEVKEFNIILVKIELLKAE